MNATTLNTIKVWSQFIHPIIMWILFGLMAYAMYLGMQSKKTRTTDDKELRKELIKKDYRNRHYQLSSILLAVMVVGTLIAMASTYVNSGKLFVNSHLLIGLGMTGLFTIAAALVPFMQKSEVARISHISINMILLLLFGWQAVTGMNIVQNVINRM
jgi:nitrate reductase gamma subunit